jgi:hypothetical protein
MPWKRIHIRNNLRLQSTRVCTANSPAKGNFEASVTALIRADLKKFRRNDAIKTSPIKSRIRVVNLARQSRHKRNNVGLTCT